MHLIFSGTFVFFWFPHVLSDDSWVQSSDALCGADFIGHKIGTLATEPQETTSQKVTLPISPEEIASILLSMKNIQSLTNLEDQSPLLSPDLSSNSSYLVLLDSTAREGKAKCYEQGELPSLDTEQEREQLLQWILRLPEDQRGRVRQLLRGYRRGTAWFEGSTLIARFHSTFRVPQKNKTEDATTLSKESPALVESVPALGLSEDQKELVAFDPRPETPILFACQKTVPFQERGPIQKTQFRSFLRKASLLLSRAIPIFKGLMELSEVLPRNANPLPLAPLTQFPFLKIREVLGQVLKALQAFDPDKSPRLLSTLRTLVGQLSSPGRVRLPASHARLSLEQVSSNRLAGSLVKQGPTHKFSLYSISPLKLDKVQEKLLAIPADNSTPPGLVSLGPPCQEVSNSPAEKQWRCPGSVVTDSFCGQAFLEANEDLEECLGQTVKPFPRVLTSPCFGLYDHYLIVDPDDWVTLDCKTGKKYCRRAQGRFSSNCRMVWENQTLLHQDPSELGDHWEGPTGVDCQSEPPVPASLWDLYWEDPYWKYFTLFPLAILLGSLSTLLCLLACRYYQLRFYQPPPEQGALPGPSRRRQGEEESSL